jgi:arsenate reductase (thioredoxin)
VTLSEEARRECPAWPGDPVRVHWDVDDPLSAEKADIREWKFRKCYATLESRIASLLKTRPAQSQSELLLQLKVIGMVV